MQLDKQDWLTCLSSKKTIIHPHDHHHPHLQLLRLIILPLLNPGRGGKTHPWCATVWILSANVEEYECETVDAFIGQPRRHERRGIIVWNQSSKQNEIRETEGEREERIESGQETSAGPARTTDKAGKQSAVT